MKSNLNYSPLGCGPYQGQEPVFPDDFPPRLKQLDLGPEELYLAWELVRLTGCALDTRQQRALMLLVLATRVAAAEGSTRLPLISGGYLDRILEELATSAEERAVIHDLLAGARPGDSGPANRALAALFGAPGDYRPFIFDHGSLYIQKLHVLEARVGENLRALWNLKPVTAPGGAIRVQPKRVREEALEEVLNNPPVGPEGKIVLDKEQVEAVRAALDGRLTIISGRPGSGKTSIVASILRVLVRLNEPPLESMVLAAPTGRAADRLRQATMNHLIAIPQPGAADRRLADACPPALTLHRLLGYSPDADRFWHNEYNLLPEQLVIVDESSMIDLVMMDQLLRALQPESRIVFLGDADQLPAVGVGTVLRDLCRSERAVRRGCAVVLKHSYRAREEDTDGKKILEIAAAVNAGRLSVTAAGESFRTVNRATELCFRGVEHLEAVNEKEFRAFWAGWENLFWSGLPDLKKYLLREYASGPAGFDEETTAILRLVLDYYDRFRLLTVTRVAAGGTGAEVVNSWFHYRWREKLKASGEVSVQSSLLVGEPVLVTRNDYYLRLFNGDAGLLLKIRPFSETGSRPAELMAVFPRGGSFFAYPLPALRGGLELAWATTVHKAQGSEFDHVAILLPTVPVRPLTRELLYTAITRARQSVTFVGSRELLELGVTRKMERASGLVDML